MLNARSFRIVMGAALICLVLGSPGPGSPMWFDETGGQSSYATFGDLSRAYASFLGTASSTLGFNDLGEGDVLGTQYKSQYGVSFQNTANGRYAAYSGVRAEGGAIAENVTGYDGSYMPNGDRVYVKFDNEYSTSPFTILFDNPVNAIGAFVGMGVQGSVHSLQVSVYGTQGELLGRHQVQSWLWETSSSAQNYESFFAVKTGGASIARLEILNEAKDDFANALILDNLSFGSASLANTVPEPTTLVFLLGASGALLISRIGRRGPAA